MVAAYLLWILKYVYYAYSLVLLLVLCILYVVCIIRGMEVLCILLRS